ncbi:hypothetical protein RHMOL_Rhmol09G0051200 [Rhododendron molle]|uniref:Uncharacterized protein n=1 Tax=Rhododendron molle TaxID=49168 RepID=A0ACC0MA63_RHOML|nr:hypothetical protein RHMOL_Rhmol09G0051200 [Rhododendron molle]
MKPSPVDLYADLEDPNSTMAMDVDDVDAEFFGEGPLVSDNKLADADFFNSFQDDFDDADINYIYGLSSIPQPATYVVHVSMISEELRML